MKKMISSFILVMFFFAQSVPSFALPTGQEVQSGQADFVKAGDQVLNVNQLSDRLITNYQSFSIAGNEIVHFNQPSSSSVALNRVVGPDPSAILGQMTANGKIFLINPNGVLFGSSARVDTAGLVASTLDISNQDFLAGRYQFLNPGSGSVINQGRIITPGGFVSLLGSHVENAGIIDANLGSVALASGNQITLNLDPQGLISVVIDQPLKDKILADDAVKNSGQISAEGGRVILTAKSLDGLVKNSVNNTGIITAKSLVNKNGEIYLLGSLDNATVVNTGILDTSAKEQNAGGGFVEVSGAHMDLINGRILTFKNGEGVNGKILFDPLNFTIDDAWAALFANQDGSDITVEAIQDIDFQISNHLLDLKNFDTETFYVHAGRNIDQNGVTVVTHGGNVNFLSDAGNIDLSAPIQTNGGNVDVEATLGNVTHSNLADVITSGGHFRGKAGGDYTINNGVMINTNNGVIDLYAEHNLVLGTPGNNNVTTYGWNYLSDSRAYSFIEFGYYYFDQNNNIVYVPVAQGPDIGKDGISPTSGNGVVNSENGFGVYTKFKRGSSGYIDPGDDSGVDHWTYYSDPTLNEIGNNHLIKVGNQYGWEDLYKLGDRDFNDAVFNFNLSHSSATQGVTLTSNTNIFLTAKQGSVAQAGGNIHANNLAIETNTGISGTASNGGLSTDVNDISVLNKSSGDIKISNDKSLNITDQTNLTGLNTGVTGHNGVSNEAPDGKINLAVSGNLLIDAPVSSKGDIDINADGNIRHSSKGVVTINNGIVPFIGPPTDVQSISHQENVWSNHSTVDITWKLPDAPQGKAKFTANAGGSYTMDQGSEITTNNGDATIHAKNNVKLTLVNAGDANVKVTSDNGSILNNNLSKLPTDYNVIARNIALSAPNGTVGPLGSGGQIILGHPFTFSWQLDENPSTVVDNTTDAYTTTLDSNGDWLFAKSFPSLHDSDGWFFHVATQDASHGLSSSTVHSGPYLIDTVAPVITASYDPANIYGWYNHDVQVNFQAQDERSGFAPAGALNTNLASKTSTGEGNGLIVTSDGIFDRAGNQALPINVLLNVDKTAPVISSGTPQGTPGPNGTYLSDVTVPFSATDNLSGFPPSGNTNTNLPSVTTSGNGSNLIVTSGTVSDLAGNVALPINVGPFNALQPPGNPTGPTTPGGSGSLFDDLSNTLKLYRVYYEILQPSQFLSFEPALKIGLYAYHPLTQMENKTQDINLEVGAYDFIENNIQLKEKKPVSIQE